MVSFLSLQHRNPGATSCRTFQTHSREAGAPAGKHGPCPRPSARARCPPPAAAELQHSHMRSPEWGSRQRPPSPLALTQLSKAWRGLHLEHLPASTVASPSPQAQVWSLRTPGLAPSTPTCWCSHWAGSTPRGKVGSEWRSTIFLTLSPQCLASTRHSVSTC